MLTRFLHLLDAVAWFGLYAAGALLTVAILGNLWLWLRDASRYGRSRKPYGVRVLEAAMLNAFLAAACVAWLYVSGALGG